MPKKLRRRKKLPLNAVRPVSPSRRRTPWVAVAIRTEHYAMLRELGTYYGYTLGGIAATLITRHFLTVLAETSPEQAADLKKELTSEPHKKNLYLDDMQG